jgi:hypothetical protein
VQDPKVKPWHCKNRKKKKKKGKTIGFVFLFLDQSSPEEVGTCWRDCGGNGKMRELMYLPNFYFFPKFLTFSKIRNCTHSESRV